MQELRFIAPTTYRLRTLLANQQGISALNQLTYKGSMLHAPFSKGTRTTPSVNRKASVTWNGRLTNGTGTMSTESGVLNDTQYSFRTRFAKGIGTNPDELIAASLGGCFSMALSNELELVGLRPEKIETAAVATLEELKGGWTLTRIQLDVHAKVPNATQNDFIDAALNAKTQCPVGRLLNTNICMTATLDK
jgi:osmotically inducible protein OsmC